MSSELPMLKVNLEDDNGHRRQGRFFKVVGTRPLKCRHGLWVDWWLGRSWKLTSASSKLSNFWKSLHASQFSTHQHLHLHLHAAFAIFSPLSRFYITLGSANVRELQESS